MSARQAWTRLRSGAPVERRLPRLDGCRDGKPEEPPQTVLVPAQRTLDSEPRVRNLCLADYLGLSLGGCQLIRRHVTGFSSLIERCHSTYEDELPILTQGVANCDTSKIRIFGLFEPRGQESEDFTVCKCGRRTGLSKVLAHAKNASDATFLGIPWQPLTPSQQHPNKARKMQARRKNNWSRRRLRITYVYGIEATT